MLLLTTQVDVRGLVQVLFTCIDEQKARGPVARPKHGRPGTAQAQHGPEDTGPGLGTARVPGRAWAARQARRVARHGPQ